MTTVTGYVRDQAGDLLADAVVHLIRRDTGALLGSVVSGDGSEAQEGDPYYNDMAMLLHGEGTDLSTTITDSGPGGSTITRYGDTCIKTSQKKFGLSSIYFDGVGDYLSVANNNFNFGTGAFTAECWAYPTSYPQSAQHIFDTRTTDANGFSLGIQNDGNLFLFSNSAFRVEAGSISLDQWTHVAVTCDGSGNVRCFVNGTQVGTTWNKGSLSYSQTTLLIGKYYNGTTFPFVGFMDEIRITKGMARYTANFTIPDAAFLDTAEIPARPLGQYSIDTTYSGEVQRIVCAPDTWDPIANDLIDRIILP